MPTNSAALKTQLDELDQVYEETKDAIYGCSFWEHPNAKIVLDNLVKIRDLAAESMREKNSTSLN